MSHKPKSVDELPYRLCVGVALFDRKGRVWAGRRADAPDEAEGAGTWWQMPQGGLDKDEDPYEGALRELYEETSVRSVSLIRAAPGWLKYDLPVELIGRSWGGRYRGQKQKWFAMRFGGDDAEVNIAPPGHPVEFDSWRWAPASDLLDLVVPFKRDVYAAVLAEIGHLARPE